MTDKPTLIDVVHEATFTEPRTMMFVRDKYALRMLLRRAHRFMLADSTSRLVGDFSIAVAADLESSRRLAVPPFPVTWFELNNTARMARTRELGVKVLDPGPADGPYGPPVERCGWLVHPASQGGHYCTYFAESEKGPFALPFSYWWHTAEPDHDKLDGPLDTIFRGTVMEMQWLSFGMGRGNVGPSDAYLFPAAFQPQLEDQTATPDTVIDMMTEMAGEQRHIWGLMVALGAGQLGVEADTSGRVLHSGPPKIMKNSKPLLPLEHKVLHLHLAKRATAEKVLMRVITHHKKRWHEVRSHWRTYKNPDGSVRRRTLIEQHARGDERLGRVEKTYVVER